MARGARRVIRQTHSQRSGGMTSFQPVIRPSSVLADAVGYWPVAAYSGSGPLLDASGHGLDLSLGTLANTQPLRIGSSGTGTRFADFEFFGAALFRRELQPGEVTYLATEMGVA